MVDPGAGFARDEGASRFVVVIFGGLGSIVGSVIAGFILAMLEVFVTYYIGATWALPLFLLTLLVVLLFRPKGLLGKW